MVEMNETANILNNVSERSLVILDEIGRGTSTYDGLSIAWAVAEFLQASGAKTLFATHYHHLNDLAERLPGVRNYRAAVKEEGHHIVWLRKIIPGGTDRSYGIQVARLAGLPASVVTRAREILAALERDELTRGGRPSLSGTPGDPQRQLALFHSAPAEDPIRQRIAALEVDRITPLEALTLLAELKKDAQE